MQKIADNEKGVNPTHTPGQVSKCCGLGGRLFGHLYRPRYSTYAPDREVSGKILQRVLDVVELLHAATSRRYECDVCQRCGSIAQRPKVPR